MAETHTIEIDENGAITITVRGVKGKSCKNITKQVEQALGRTITSTPTGEYYEEAKNIAKH